MYSGIQGKYFSFTSASQIAAGSDLIVIAETTIGKNVVAKKLSLITSGSISIDINNTGIYSTLYKDTDNLYRLSLDANDCVISSIVLGTTTASPIYLSMIY